MNIREVGIADIPELTRIYNEGVEDRIATYLTQPQTESTRLAWFLMLPARCKVLAAFDETGRMAGWASLNPVKHSAAPHVFDHISNISVYVARESRGKGIGLALLHALDKTARAQGFTRLELDVFDFNTAAIRLYEKAGFTVAGTYHNRAVYEGKPSNVVFMEKSL
ncbi:GNAT family N-acetyltransferase [Acetanaerobacterium elongatum]|nr:GNAT family N-acetyltransferase [Acetanaerobacterium elongatum]